jgi:hypothetical protein
VTGRRAMKNAPERICRVVPSVGDVVDLAGLNVRRSMISHTSSVNRIGISPESQAGFLEFRNRNRIGARNIIRKEKQHD